VSKVRAKRHFETAAEPNEEQMMAYGKQYPTTTIVALAGRRVDPEHAKVPRFPPENVDDVRRRIADALDQLQATALVCSAACGADLVGLEAAEQLGLRRRIVLPFPPPCFRKTSVVDRSEDWGPVFDHQIATAAVADDLVVLNLEGEEDQAYAAANEAIIQEAQGLAGQTEAHRLVAMLVWEGAKRQGSDATAGFRESAKRAGFMERSILTL
jgi:hypothetical protein